MGQACGTYEGEDNCIHYFGEEAWKRPLGRPKRGKENIIKTEIKCDGKVRTKLVWLRTVISGWLFLTRYTNCGFNARHRIPWVWQYSLVKKDLVISVQRTRREGFCSPHVRNRGNLQNVWFKPPPPQWNEVKVSQVIVLISCCKTSRKILLQLTAYYNYVYYRMC